MFALSRATVLAARVKLEIAPVRTSRYIWTLPTTANQAPFCSLCALPADMLFSRALASPNHCSLESGFEASPPPRMTSADLGNFFPSKRTSNRDNWALRYAIRIPLSQISFSTTRTNLPACRLMSAKVSLRISSIPRPLLHPRSKPASIKDR